MTTATVSRLSAKDRQRANDKIHGLTQGYGPIPCDAIEDVLIAVGYRTEDYILCGREGRATFNLYAADDKDCIGETCPNSMLVLTWYKVAPHKYETVAYLS